MNKGFLKNYTSDVAPSITIGRIESVLVRAGVFGVTKEYGSAGEVTAIRFQIPINKRMVDIRMPADAKAAQHALFLDYIGDDLLPDGKIKWGCKKKLREKDFEEQGKRTAWRLLQDWIEVQMSQIHLKQTEPLQVFMGYIWDGKQTTYEKLKASNYAGLLPETTA